VDLNLRDPLSRYLPVMAVARRCAFDLVMLKRIGGGSGGNGLSETPNTRKVALAIWFVNDRLARCDHFRHGAIQP
jgi:hypothetical protein